LCLLVTWSCSDTPENKPDAGPSPTAQVDAAELAVAEPAEAGSSAAGTQPLGDAASSAISAVLGDAAVQAPTIPESADASVQGEYLGLAQPATGFRIKTRGAPVPTGADLELCEIAEVPGTPGQEYIVGAVEVANGRSSHHLIVSAALPNTATEEKLRSMAIGEQVPCVSAQIEFGEGLIAVAASQNTLAKSAYSDGVGMRMFGGQRLVFDYHYFNYTGMTLQAESAVAFHTLMPSQVHNIANIFSFTNMTIDTPPSSRGTFTAACRFKHDVMLQGIGRHTHTNGTDFTVWYDGGPNDGQQIWKSLDWEHDTGYVFPQPTLFKADQGFKFACSFRNDSTKPLRFGIQAKDEMCILTGAIWSPSPGVESDPESCVVTWIDAQGIGHDAKDNGGVPKPSSDELLACTLDTVGFSFLDQCVGCICSSCAGPLTRCYADPDCKAIMDCRSACQGQGASCDRSCDATLREHSSGVGMASQVGLCLSVECGSDCALPDATQNP
jgi:hypothetical protein